MSKVKHKGPAVDESKGLGHWLEEFLSYWDMGQFKQQNNNFLKGLEFKQEKWINEYIVILMERVRKQREQKEALIYKRTSLMMKNW